MSQSRKALVAIAVCALLWSSGGLFIKLVDWHPLAIAGARSLIASLFILAYLRRPKLNFSFPQVAAALSYACTMVLFVTANKMTTAANTILLQYSAPIFVAFFGWFILGEKPSLDNWLALVFVVGGMVLFFMDELSPGSTLGNALAIVSGIAFAFFSVFMRMQKSGSPLESMLLAHWMVVLIALPFMAAERSPGLLGLAALGGLGVLQIGLSSVFFSYGIKHVTAIMAMLVAVLEPILNPLWVFFATGERPGNWAIAGGLLIVFAVTISSVLSARRLQASQVPAAGAGTPV